MGKDVVKIKQDKKTPIYLQMKVETTKRMTTSRAPSPAATRTRLRLGVYINILLDTGLHP